jgi:hypothetical protein
VSVVIGYLLFGVLPKQPGLVKRRARLADTIAWLVEIFAVHSPAANDELVVIDSTAVECGRSLDTARRSALADVAGYGYSRSHSRWFWVCACTWPVPWTGHPARSCYVVPTKKNATSRCASCCPWQPTIAVCDKGYAGREFAEHAARLGVTVIRPRRQNETGPQPHLAPIRQRIESVFQTCKDLLSLERHGAHTITGLNARIGLRPLALTASIWLNHQLSRPSRTLADLTA